MSQPKKKKKPQTPPPKNSRTGIYAAVTAAVVLAAVLLILLTPRGNGADVHHVEIEVADYGTISLELDGKTAPITQEHQA